MRDVFRDVIGNSCVKWQAGFHMGSTESMQTSTGDRTVGTEEDCFHAGCHPQGGNARMLSKAAGRGKLKESAA